MKFYRRVIIISIFTYNTLFPPRQSCEKASYLGYSPMFQDTPSFLAYWRNARSRMVRVLGALTHEDLQWAPIPRAFAFGDLYCKRNK